MGNEIAMLFLTSIASLVCLNYKKEIKEVEGKLLVYSLYTFLIACISTVAEEFVFPILLDYVEHIAYLVCSVFTVLWIFRYTSSNTY